MEGLGAFADKRMDFQFKMRVATGLLILVGIVLFGKFVVEPLAGKATNVDVAVTFVATISVASNAVLGLIWRQRAKEIADLKARNHRLTTEVMKLQAPTRGAETPPLWQSDPDRPD